MLAYLRGQVERRINFSCKAFIKKKCWGYEQDYYYRFPLELSKVFWFRALSKSLCILYKYLITLIQIFPLLSLWEVSEMLKVSLSHSIVLLIKSVAEIKFFRSMMNKENNHQMRRWDTKLSWLSLLQAYLLYLCVL